MRPHALAVLLCLLPLAAPGCATDPAPATAPDRTAAIDPATAPTLRLAELAVAIETDDFARALALLDTMNAADEAEKALAAGDRRLLALAGYGPIIPGLTANPADAAAHPTWPLPATDSLTDHATYQRNAFHFAQAYNEAILAAGAER